uniref:Coatomer subunit epsilon n=1 Tax=Ditylenchus dipsaci TaxID=166011 RepID=A0A915CYS7_9BILA
MAPEIDVLFDVRNNFYLGAFQQSINDAQNAKVKSGEDGIVKDTYLYRSYISLNKTSIPLGEIDSSLSPASHPLGAIRRFADYIANVEKRKKIVDQISGELESGSATDDVCLLMSSFIFNQEGNVDDALRVLSKASSLECQAATVQCLLKINRVDLAIKELKKMQEVDEDSTLSQLALAWVNMAAGKDKLKDAFYIYQEMIDKYGATALLLVSQASCLIQQQKYDDAEKLLQDAQQRDANNPEVLIGLVVVTQFLGKPLEVTNRYINQLKQEYPHHVWTKDYTNKELDFDRLVEETSA